MNQLVNTGTSVVEVRELRPQIVITVLIGLWIAFILAMLGYAAATIALEYWFFVPKPVFKT